MRTSLSAAVFACSAFSWMWATTPLFAGDLPEPLAAAVTARVEREIEAQNIVGISIALVQEGKVVHTQHFGWEDRENEIPATDATMYRWASISKPLTAVVAMQLWQEGKLDLDGDVRVLVPEFPEAVWEEQPAVITARQLLCHQGGVVHYVNGPVVRTPRPELNGRYESIIDALDTFKASPLVCAPGSRYSYTTHGYILLGAVAERAGEAPFPELVRQRIISPLGMATLRPDYQWEEISNRAVGYRRARGAGDDAEMVVSSDTDVSWKLAGGGWISNVNDLGLLATGMLNHQLVTPETRELMWARQQTAEGQQTGYGLGFQIAEFEGKQRISHGGSQEKARTLLTMVPEEMIAVAIMCNTEGTNLGGLGMDLLKVLAAGGAEAGVKEKAGAAPAVAQ